MSKEAQEYDRDAALANLTDEERAAIEDGDVDPADQQAGANDKADDDEGDDLDVDAGAEEDGDDDNDDDGTGGADAAGKEAETGDHEAGGALSDDDALDDNGEADAASYQAQLPDGYNDKLKALDDGEAELSRKFRAGEIEADDFLTETKRLSSERTALDRAATKAEIAREMAEQNSAQTWQRKVRALMRDAKADDGIDYERPLLGAALDKAIKDLAAKDEHADKSMSWFLKEAHKQVKSELGIEKRTKSDDPQKTRKLDTSKLPASLANVPGSDGPGDVGDEFADIDKLDGLAYEQALARMTAGQRERYLAAV